MTFTSYLYFALLGSSILCLTTVPPRRHWIVLLVASYVFYGYWRADHMLLLAGSTLLNYLTAIYLEGSGSTAARLWVLRLNIAANLLILGWFKYIHFVVSTAGEFGAAVPPWIEHGAAAIILPIGLSFYTLQSIGYAIDVYFRRVPAERHLGVFALFVAYFPQLVAGPIERARSLLPQLRRGAAFDWDDVRLGGMLVLWGLFKKIMAADPLGRYVWAVYADPASVASGDALIVTFVSFLYVYMDFSAYTDIARGSGQIMGIRLSENFRRPLAAPAVRQFWLRWHMTLTLWIVEYFHAWFSRLSPSQGWRHFAVLATFVLIGFWHGASWNFVVFGLIHGAIVIVEGLAARARLRWPEGSVWDFLRIARTFVLVSSTGFLFLAPDLTASLELYRSLLDLPAAGLSAPLAAGSLTWLEGLAVALFIEAVQWWGERRPLWPRLLRAPIAVRWSVCYALLLVVIAHSNRPGPNFLYFQF